MSSDLAYTLVASFGIFFMGIIVYFHDRQSVTNRLFFLMSLSTFFWSFANYFSVNADYGHLLLWIRLVLFFAVPHAVLFLLFVYNFPNRNLAIKLPFFWFLMCLIILTMAATVSPFVFSGVSFMGSQAIPVVGILMPLFAVVVLGSLISGLVLIIKKYRGAKSSERTQWKFMLIGVSASYILLILTNFILVVAFGNTYFTKFGPLFMLPAVVGMGYAILKHKLLNVKTVATELLTFVILAISLFEVLTAEGFANILLRLGLFALFFLFGIFLIRSVLKEVEQREKLEIVTKQLESANEQLKELDHLKSEFLSFASHQIKAPLAVMKGFATLIHDGTYGEVPAKVSEAAEKIKISADKMAKLVSDFLNIRKIEEGKMSYKFEKLDAAKMVGEIFEELKPLAENKKLEFTLETQAIGSWINADAQNIRQVFQNLIENAIKYTDSGFVKVRTESHGSQFFFSVSDSGHGMSQELIPHLFEQFKRDAAVKQIEGTGLGLYIAHEITTAHKGEILVESDGPGKGSKFVVKIPLA
jgi:signal transduction histidine kinase